MTDKKGLIKKIRESGKINLYIMILVIGLLQLLFMHVYNQLPIVDLNSLPGEYVTIYFVGLWGLLNTFMIFFYAIVKKLHEINYN